MIEVTIHSDDCDIATLELVGLDDVDALREFVEGHGYKPHVKDD